MEERVLYEKTSPIRLFFIVAIPGMISMLMSSIYQVIDGVFVGQFLGSQGFAALNLAMPLVIINFAFADLIGVGSSVPIAIKLGEEDRESACNIFTSACIMIIFTGTLLGAVFFFGADTLLSWMGAEGNLSKLAGDYLRVCALASPFITILFAVDNYLRICGKVKYSMMMNIIMALSIIVIEFLFLYVFRLGIWAAALAVCLGMFIGVIVGFIPFFRGKLVLRFVKPRFTLKMIGLIIANGTPAFLNNVAGRMTSILMNVILLRLGGGTAVSAYGMLMLIDGIIIQILYGLTDSLQPSIGYNFGAGNNKRVKAIERIAIGACAIISIVSAIITFFAGDFIVRLFANSDEVAVIEMASQAIKLFSLTYVTRWISHSVQSYMSAVNKAAYASIISFCMAFIFPVILIFMLDSSLGLTSVWLNMPLTSLLTGILAIILLLLSKRRSKINTSEYIN